MLDDFISARELEKLLGYDSNGTQVVYMVRTGIIEAPMMAMCHDRRWRKVYHRDYVRDWLKTTPRTIRPTTLPARMAEARKRLDEAEASVAEPTVTETAGGAGGMRETRPSPPPSEPR